MKQGWEIKKLGEVCETSSGGTPSKTHKEYYEGGNIPWLRSGEVSQGLIYDTKLYITAEGLDNSSAKIFPIDTVVIAMYGATVGQVGVLKNAMSTNQAVCGIFPTPKFAPLFLVYYLKAKKSYFLSLAAGGAQPNISQQIIRDTYIPIPPREEQERIVEELDCLSGVIESKREQLKELDALAQSIFYQMFGDPITNEKRWEVKKLGEVASEIFAGGDKPKDFSDIQTDEYLYPIYANGEGDRGLLGYSKTYRVESKAVALGARGASIGNCRICEGKFTPVVRLITIIPSNKIDIIYLFYSVRTMSFNISGAGQAQLTTPNIINKSITIPPLSLQQEFADKIEAIEKQKELIKKSISETEILFNARMDYYFN